MFDLNKLCRRVTKNIKKMKHKTGKRANEIVITAELNDKILKSINSGSVIVTGISTLIGLSIIVDDKIIEQINKEGMCGDYIIRHNGKTQHQLMCEE